MLMTRSQDKAVRRVSDREDDSAVVELNIERLRAAARRQFRVVLLAAILGLCIGIAYIYTAVPLFTAHSDVMISTRSVRAVEEVSGAPALQSEAIDSEVELIRSEQIGMRVVETLKLHEDVDFMHMPGNGMLTAVINLLSPYIDLEKWLPAGGETPISEENRKKAALSQIQDSIDVRRVGPTYILRISYTSPDPRQSAQLANGIAKAYLTDQLDRRYDSARRAGDWLQQRVAELQRQTREADLAIQRYRAENNLIAANGRLISEQQLSELNSQLILARAETARTRARYQQIKGITESGKTDAIVGEALDQPVFNTLRASYLAAAKRAADLSSRFGAEHVQATNLRSEMLQYERLIFEELGRISASYLSDYEVARSREQSLQHDLENALGVTAAANTTLVTLRELEGRATTYRALLESFQRRFEETTQQQTFPIADARIITAADLPSYPSHPRKPLTLILSLLLGAAAGAGLGLLREYADRGFRTGAQVRSELDLEFLGMLPRVKNGDDRPNPEHGSALAATCHFTMPAPMRYAVDEPLSGFAETLRSVKVAADITLQGEDGRIIGIASTLPGEGKSITAANFAGLLVRQGKKALLIDADIRNPGLTLRTAPHAEQGLVDNLLNGTPIRDLLLEGTDCGLHFLPCPTRNRIPHTADLLASSAMEMLLRDAAREYDYVIVDCPPLNPVVDIRAAAKNFDAFLYVVEWGRTPRSLVRNALTTEVQVYDRCLGVVLSKVDMVELGAYADEGSKEYFDQRYSSYLQR
jgi:polysaccharide biosynthesis transport protein